MLGTTILHVHRITLFHVCSSWLITTARSVTAAAGHVASHPGRTPTSLAGTPCSITLPYLGQNPTWGSPDQRFKHSSCTRSRSSAPAACGETPLWCCQIMLAKPPDPSSTARSISATAYTVTELRHPACTRGLPAAPVPASQRCVPQQPTNAVRCHCRQRPLGQVLVADGRVHGAGGRPAGALRRATLGVASVQEGGQRVRPVHEASSTPALAAPMLPAYASSVCMSHAQHKAVSQASPKTL